MSWIETNLKEFVDVESGAAFKSEEFIDTGIPVVKIANISNSTLEKTKGDSYIAETELERYKNVIVNEGDVLIAMSGNTTCKMGRVSKEFAPSLVNQRVGWIKPISDEIDINFVYHLLISDTYQKRLWTFATATGQPNLSPRDIKRISFQKPHKPEQTAIATILSKVDEAIEATQNSIKAAEKLKKALMQNLLTGKLKPDGTWRTEEEFYDDEKFGKVPKGWEVKKLKDVCLNAGEYGANASAIDFEDGKARYIRITDIDDYGNLIKENKAGIEHNKVKSYLLKENDFLFARTGDTVGKSLLYKIEMGLAAFAGYLIKFTFTPKIILPEYFNLIAKSDIFEAFKIAMQRVGAKPNINSREYGSFRFLLPNEIAEQIIIYEKAKPLDNSIIEKQTKIQTLQRLKKSLMQNLLTGKVRLPADFIAQFESAVEETIERQK